VLAGGAGAGMVVTSPPGYAGGWFRVVYSRGPAVAS